MKNIRKKPNEMTTTILKGLAIATLFVAIVLAIPVMGGALIGGIVGSLVGMGAVVVYYQRGVQGTKSFFQQSGGKIGSYFSQGKSTTTRAKAKAKTKSKSKARAKAKARTAGTAKVVHIKHKSTTAQVKKRRQA